jgi:hypothetical protein
MPELFARFEVNAAPRWPILLRLTVASVVLHATALACLIFIPPVREAFNIAAIFSNTSFVDRPYEKTEIGGDVQIVSLTKFHYPEGYFAMDAGLAPLPPPSPSPTPLQWAVNILPSMNPPEKVKGSPTPSASPTASASPATGNGSQVATVSPAPSPGAPQTEAEKEKAQAEKAQDQLEKTAAANGVDLPVDNEINRQPLRDLAKYANELKKGGKLDLDQKFEVVVEAELDENSTLQKPTFVQKAGDPALVDLAGKMIAALNDSKMLVLLKALNDGQPTKVVFIIRQDDSELVARIESDVASEASAKQKAGVFNLMLAAGEKARDGKDEAILMRNTSASADGKKVVFKFSMPRQAVGDMIKKQIASNAEAKQG